jgi:segregation and condensation protein A
MSYYTVKTANFEGPFGLLLDLIDKHKLFINDLSLATVTEDYLNYVNDLRQKNTEGDISRDVSNFIVVAATLILIKSKSLLPNLNLTDEEQSDIKTLEERLRLYELFTGLSLNIKRDFGKNIIFNATEHKRNVLVFLPDDRITSEKMMEFAKDVLGRVPKKVFLPEVEVKKVISIEEMIGRLTLRIEGALKMSFQDFLGKGKPTSREEKVEVIVGFLAMLELVRQGILDAVQGSHREDILIEKISQNSNQIN